MVLVLAGVDRMVCHFGLPCGSFVVASRGTTLRSFLTPMGNENIPSVALGNLLTSRPGGCFERARFNFFWFENMRKFSIIQDFFQDGPPHHDDWCNGRDLDFGATIIKYHMETSSLSATCENVQSFSALTSAVVSSGPRICLHDAVTCVFYFLKNIFLYLE